MAPRSADGVVLSELSTLNTTSPNTTLNKVVPHLPLCVETPGTQNHSHHAPNDIFYLALRNFVSQLVVTYLFTYLRLTLRNFALFSRG